MTDPGFDLVAAAVPPVGAQLQRIAFLPQVSDGAAAVLRFQDPVAAYAVRVDAQAGGELFAVAVFPWGESPEAFAAWSARVGDAEGMPPIYLKSRGIEVWWSPGQAVLQCETAAADALVAGLVEFEWYERALRALETEVAGAWGELEEDKALAFDVSPLHLRGGDVTGERMGRAFGRRIRFARLEPHLYQPDLRLQATAQKLGEDLREKALLEDRAEALDAHLETSEHIYEMASQRMGEFRASQQGHRVEWIIIWLLVAEVTLSLIQTLLKR